jgi:aspartate racemase
MSKPSKTVGILGGMGPYATLAFFKLVLERTPAAKDWDHLRVIIDNNPHIPSRTRHALYGEASPLPGMLESCLRLQDYPVDIIAIPCNSAAIFVPELRARVRIPILHICEIAADALAAAHPAARRIATLGGHVTHHQRTYAPFLAAHGMELVDHGPAIQQQVQDMIESLKLGEANPGHSEAMRQLVRRLKMEWRVDAVISACTEFGCLPALAGEVPVVDSSRELAAHVVRLAQA